MHILERPSINGAGATIHTETLPARRRRFPWRIVAALVAIVAIVTTSAIVISRRASAVTYTTVPLVRSTLVAQVTATGTVNPQDTINVGTQQSGTISELDVDYNSHVRKGQVLARIDPTSFQDALNSARAQLAQAQAQANAQAASANGAQSSIAAAQATERSGAANAVAAQSTARSAAAAVASAQSNVTKAQSALALAQQTVNRDAGLLAQGYVAQNQADADRSNLVAAQSALDGAQTAVMQARAQAAASASQAVASLAQQQAQNEQQSVAQSAAGTASSTHQAAVAAIGIAAASVANAEENVRRTVITSPVDGTVISRGVSIGQTVAASFQTPTLFSIARDLTKMQIDVAVGEPDIGAVKPRENVDFSVLAYPGVTFHGTVAQVRQNPTTVSNVVTYDTVVRVDNPDGKLRPGMTANVSLAVAHVDDALIVPLQALQYTPASGTIARRHRTQTGAANAPAGARAAASVSPWGQTGAGTAGVVATGSRGRVFVQTTSGLRPVGVRIGLVSGANVAVTPLRGALHPNDAIVVADSSAPSGHARTSTTNPFAGQQPQRGGGGGSPMGGLR